MASAHSSWGASLRSCDTLLRRIEANDPSLVHLIILPTKSFGADEAERLSTALIEQQQQQQQQQRATHLQSIQASSHALPPNSLFRLGTAIATCPTVQMLAIGDSSMNDEGVAALCHGLGSDNSLDVLDLSFKGFGTPGLLVLMETFGGSRCLRHLDISRNEKIGLLLDDNNSVHHPMPLAFPSLERVDLSSCNISVSFLQRFVQSIGANGVLSLHVNDNPLGDGALETIMNHMHRFSELHCSDCGLGDDSMNAWTSASDLSTSVLGIFDISGNLLGQRSGTALAQCLKVLSFPHLRELNLSRNPLGPDGVRAIVQSLHCRASSVPPLRLLDLSDTHCGPEAAKLAIEVSGVKSLRLAHNALNSDGFRFISAGLQGGHRSMDSLDLSSNGADASSVGALLSALLTIREVWPSLLRTLVLGGNGVSDEIEELVAVIQGLHPGLDIARDRVS